jgi:hypothetical protein
MPVTEPAERPAQLKGHGFALPYGVSLSAISGRLLSPATLTESYGRTVCRYLVIEDHGDRWDYPGRCWPRRLV